MMVCFWNGLGLDDFLVVWVSFMLSWKKVILKKVFIGMMVDI